MTILVFNSCVSQPWRHITNISVANSNNHRSNKRKLWSLAIGSANACGCIGAWNSRSWERQLLSITSIRFAVSIIKFALIAESNLSTIADTQILNHVLLFFRIHYYDVLWVQAETECHWQSGEKKNIFFLVFVLLLDEISLYSFFFSSCISFWVSIQDNWRAPACVCLCLFCSFNSFALPFESKML